MAADPLPLLPLDVSDVLFSFLHNWPPMSLASTALSAQYGQWLVRRYRNCVESLDESGFSVCKLFLRHGGFDVGVGSAHFVTPPGGDICTRGSNDFKVRPLEIIQNMSRGWYLTEPYTVLAQKTPSFMGALLSELCFRSPRCRSNLPRDAEGYIDGFEEIDKTIIRRMQALLPDFPRYKEGYIREFHDAFASSVASVPLAVARRCGLQQWILQLAEHIIHPVASSTKAFLKMKNTCSFRDSSGYKFMNVLAVAAHCGLDSEDSNMMLRECIDTIIHDEDTLRCEIGGDYISLRRALSLLAMTPFANNGWYLDRILEAACVRAEKDQSPEEPEDAFQCLHEILVNGQCDFHPKLGFKKIFQWKIHQLKETLISRSVDRAGTFVLSEWKIYSWSDCSLVLEALWNIDMEFGPADGHYFDGRPDGEANFNRKLERERSKRQEWIDRFLRGIVTTSRNHQVAFSSEDAEQIRKLGQQHPEFMSTLEDFVDQMLVLQRF